MPLYIVPGDICRIYTDAIVNPTDPYYSGRGGTDAHIHSCAGKGYADYCSKLPSLSPGAVSFSPGFDLSCKYIINTMGPIWNGGLSGEHAALKSCYINSLELAMSLGCESIAFPIISSGTFGYPKEQALSAATQAISAYLSRQDMTVYLVVHNPELFKLSDELYNEVSSYISRNFFRDSIQSSPWSDNILVDECSDFSEASSPSSFSFTLPASSPKEAAAPKPKFSIGSHREGPYSGLQQRLRNKDESFSQMLLRKIDEAGMKDSECYKRANIDRRVFSKIRSNPAYSPSKPTAVAFAIALRLDIDETEEFLRKAGFALSYSNEFDIIIRYFISRKSYDIHEINTVLYSFDQSLLGSS